MALYTWHLSICHSCCHTHSELQHRLFRCECLWRYVKNIHTPHKHKHIHHIHKYANTHAHFCVQNMRNPLHTYIYIDTYLHPAKVSLEAPRGLIVSDSELLKLRKSPPRNHTPPWVLLLVRGLFCLTRKFRFSPHAPPTHTLNAHRWSYRRCGCGGCLVCSCGACVEEEKRPQNPAERFTAQWGMLLEPRTTYMCTCRTVPNEYRALYTYSQNTWNIVLFSPCSLNLSHFSLTFYVQILLEPSEPSPTLYSGISSRETMLANTPSSASDKTKSVLMKDLKGMLWCLHVAQIHTQHTHTYTKIHLNKHRKLT